MMSNTILAFDLDLLPIILTYDPNLAKVKINLHTKYQGHRSNSSNRRAQADGRTVATKCIISLLC